MDQSDLSEDLYNIYSCYTLSSSIDVDAFFVH